MDSERRDDIERLNGLVDGELSSAERADLAARLAADRDLASAHATLARLKVAISETVEDCPSIDVPRPRGNLHRPRAMAVAACLLALGCALILWHGWWVSESDTTEAAEGPMQIALVSLPPGTVVPRLDTAGLKLVSLTFHPSGTPLFAASYRGPHGCRLDLRAWPAGIEAARISGTSVRRWTAGELAYELTAHGMPEWRFKIVAEGAVEQTRIGSDPRRIERSLREANRGAPPCLS